MVGGEEVRILTQDNKEKIPEKNSWKTIQPEKLKVLCESTGSADYRLFKS